MFQFKSPFGLLPIPSGHVSLFGLADFIIYLVSSRFRKPLFQVLLGLGFWESLFRVLLVLGVLGYKYMLTASKKGELFYHI
jgi:hypothetical protein